MSEKVAKRKYSKHLTLNPPEYLDRKGKALWRKLAPEIRNEQGGKPLDSSLLETFCSQYSIYRNAYDHIREHGEVQPIYKPVQNAAGEIIDHTFVGFKRNPMTSIYNSAITSMTKIGAELGLSPKSRAEIMTVIPKPKNTKSTMAKMKEMINDE